MSFRALVFRNTFLVVASLAASLTAAAQQRCPATIGPGGPRDSVTLSIQPRLLVWPYAASGVDRKTLLEKDFDLRLALNVIREKFDDEGFTTLDFAASSMAPCGICSPAAQESQARTYMMATSPDVFVETEFRVTRDGSNISTVVILTAKDASTNSSLANTTGRSGPNAEQDVTKHLEAALAAAMPRFLSNMNTKWTDYLTKGRPIAMNISLARGATINMESLVGPNKVRLADEIQDFFKCNAWRGYYNTSGMSADFMNVPDVRIPLRDETGSRVFTADDFARRLVDHLKKVGVTAQRNMQNNTMFLALNAAK